MKAKARGNVDSNTPLISYSISSFQITFLCFCLILTAIFWVWQEKCLVNRESERLNDFPEVTQQQNQGQQLDLWRVCYLFGVRSFSFFFFFPAFFFTFFFWIETST